MKTILKKRYGQHFLRDTGIINRIVALISPAPNDLMIEIGGGDGALSTRLAPEVLRLLVMEIDHDLIPALRSTLAPYPCAEVLGLDVLHADLANIAAPYLSPQVRLRVVGNLPYNIGTAISFAGNDADFRHCSFSISIEKLGAVSDDSFIFLVGAWHIPWHIDEGNHRDIKAIAKADKPGAFVRGINIYDTSIK